MAQPLLKRVAHCLRGQRCPIAQVEFVDPENIAGTVIGDDPAFGHAGNHLAAGIDPDQAHRNRGANMLSGRVQPDPVGIQFARVCNKGDFNHAIVSSRATRSQQDEEKSEKGKAHG